jgi:nitrogen fixation protein NifB
MTPAATGAKRELYRHPCFCGSKGARWGRVHLPVAPHCNVQCNFCSRLYDCANESRPAVTKSILGASDALKYLDDLLRDRPEISVVGIAGPGDPMSEPERTLDTIRRVNAGYPNLLLCLSTNGLALPEHVDALALLGVTHVTVTMNAVDPVLGSRIYRWVRMGDRVYRGREGAELLLGQQRSAIVRLKARGLVVKVNTVVLPGLNADHIGDIAAEAASLGADIMNCIPMIPVPGTPFEYLGEPGAAEMHRVRAIAARHIPQMYHCRRCRADAAGFLHGGDQEETPARVSSRACATGRRL